MVPKSCIVVKTACEDFLPLGLSPCHQGKPRSSSPRGDVNQEGEQDVLWASAVLLIDPWDREENVLHCGLGFLERAGAASVSTGYEQQASW